MAAKTYLVNGNKVSLYDKDYKTTGGEGIIYTKGNIVYKIFLDDTKQIPLSKVEELNRLLNQQNILKPINPIYTENKKYVGFTMRYINDTQPLCRIFTNTYRKQFGITPEMSLKLVEKFQEDMDYIHKQKCLIVDCSEFNFLVDNTFSNIYFIDTNSYQTPSFPATAITPGIKDYHSNIFTPLTDWFSFAILICQIFIGIHPYKGTHPNFKPNEFIERMKKNISIFNKDVIIPSAARDFSLIPSEYRSWFVKLFEKGERIPPPNIAGIMNIAPILTIVQSTGNLEISLIKEFSEDIKNLFSHDSKWAVVLNSCVELENKKKINIKSTLPLVQFTESSDPIIIESEDFLEFNHFDVSYNKSKEIINSVQMKISDKFISNNKLYVVFNDKFMEIVHNEISNKTIFTGSNQREFLSNSSIIFDGVIYQDTLGTPYLLIPYSNNNISCCMIKPFLELKEYRIISCKNSLGLVMVIGYRYGSYDKFIFKIKDDYSDYICFKTEKNISNIELNFITLENGIVAHIPEDGVLEIFSKRTDNDKVKIIKDSNIKSNMILNKIGARVVFTIDNKLFSMSLK